MLACSLYLFIVVSYSLHLSIVLYFRFAQIFDIVRYWFTVICFLVDYFLFTCAFHLLATVVYLFFAITTHVCLRIEFYAYLRFAFIFWCFGAYWASSIYCCMHAACMRFTFIYQCFIAYVELYLLAVCFVYCN